MLWAAACLAFFKFVRVGEFTFLGVHTFDGDIHLSPQDISVDHPQHPSVIYVTLKQSKTDQLRKEVTLILGNVISGYINEELPGYQGYQGILGRTIVRLSGWIISDTPSFCVGGP